MGFFLASIFTEILILVSTFLSFYYLRFKRNNAKFWSIRNIPHLPPKFIIGNGSEVNYKISFGEYVADLYRDHKEKKVLGYWFLNKPTIVVFDLDLIKKMLVSDFSYFHDRLPFSDPEDEPLAGHLFNLTGQKWRNMRVKLTPTFTSGKMKMMYPTMAQCGRELQEFITPFAKTGETLEIKEILGRFTMNIIASCAFGLELDCFKNPDNDFRSHGKRIFEPSTYQLLANQIAFVFPACRKLIGAKEVPQDTSDFFINAVEQTMQYRKMNGIRRNDFMQLLIQLTEKGKIEDVDKHNKEEEKMGEQVTDTPFTLLEAAAQAFVFFLAGFETSSTTMTFTIYELAKNQDVQKKLKEEIKKAIGASGESLSYEAINKLEYLDWVIEETLRKYPVVPVLMRQATKEYYMPDFNSSLPQGQFVLIPLLGISRDPEIFPDPERFDPTRFSPEEKAKRHHYSSIPFGEGPRNCIGNRFGLLQSKVGLVSLLEKFTIKPCDKTPAVLTYNPKAFVMTIQGGMPVSFVED